MYITNDIRLQSYAYYTVLISSGIIPDRYSILSRHSFHVLSSVHYQNFLKSKAMGLILWHNMLSPFGTAS